MRKVIAAINMTIDAVVDHTEGIADAEIHEHYKNLIESADVILYGRITFELMKYWQTLVNNPSGEKASDEFAVAMDNVHKIVFSKTLKTPDWQSATLSSQTPEAVVKELKKQKGKDVLVGSRSMIMQLLHLNLIDEFQLCIHPVIAGKGSSLFEQVKDRTLFKLAKTKLFKGGAVILYYEPLL